MPTTCLKYCDKILHALFLYSNVLLQVGDLRNIYHFIDLDPDVEKVGEGRTVVKASHTKKNGLQLELQVSQCLNEQSGY